MKTTNQKALELLEVLDVEDTLDMLNYVKLCLDEMYIAGKLDAMQSQLDRMKESKK